MNIFDVLDIGRSIRQQSHDLPVFTGRVEGIVGAKKGQVDSGTIYYVRAGGTIKKAFGIGEILIGESVTCRKLSGNNIISASRRSIPNEENFDSKGIKV